MSKHLCVLLAFFFVTLSSIAQNNHEGLNVDWPIEYNWKVVQQVDQGGIQSITIIPGGETTKTATILGSMKAFLNRKPLTVDSMVRWYQSNLDSGSQLTVIERKDKGKNPWVIFKVETPVTDKYPVAESDLYYVQQGEYALFENSVAIKRPVIDVEFQNRWIKIFKTAKIVKQQE